MAIQALTGAGVAKDIREAPYMERYAKSQEGIRGQLQGIFGLLYRMEECIGLSKPPVTGQAESPKCSPCIADAINIGFTDITSGVDDIGARLQAISARLFG